MKLDICPVAPSTHVDPKPDVVLACRFTHPLVFYYCFFEKEDADNKDYLNGVLHEMRCYRCGAYMAKEVHGTMEQAKLLMHWGDILERTKNGWGPKGFNT